MEDNKNKQSYGLESHFTEDVYFYRNVFMQGGDVVLPDSLKLKKLTVDELVVLGISSFYGPSRFYNDVYVDGNINAGIITARVRLDVGIGGTILTTTNGNIGVGNTTPTQKLDVNGNLYVNDRIGIGSTTPQQKVDIAGNIKIDGTIYDSANIAGKNGYFVVNDQKGLRWLPLIAENTSGGSQIGVATDGIFVLNEGVPLYPE